MLPDFLELAAREILVGTVAGASLPVIAAHGLDEHGERQDVTSDDVNAYLREITGQEFTAKDFRTWAGTVLAAMALQETAPWQKESEAKKNVVRAIEQVAERLGNTPSICRKCYVHPAIIDAYLEGAVIETLEQRIEQELADNNGLRAEEQAVMRLLQQRLEREDTNT